MEKMEDSNDQAIRDGMEFIEKEDKLITELPGEDDLGPTQLLEQRSRAKAPRKWPNPSSPSTIC